MSKSGRRFAPPAPRLRQSPSLSRWNCYLTDQPTGQHDKPFAGATLNLDQCVDTHLFIIGPNNSGSTFVAKAIEQCAATWSLAREGQHMLGYVGPDAIAGGVPLTWAGSPSSIQTMVNPANYDWHKTRKAWYFQARAMREDANVFVARTPSFLLIVNQLSAAFPGARFIFLLRNPYAIIEGICRRTGPRNPGRVEALRTATRHVVTCFEFQARNIRTHRSSGIFLSYEGICTNPVRARQSVQRLVPHLDDLDFDQKIAVKGMYDEVLRNMNGDQIGSLSDDDLEIINETMRPKMDLIRSCGYAIISGSQCRDDRE